MKKMLCFIVFMLILLLPVYSGKIYGVEPETQEQVKVVFEGLGLADIGGMDGKKFQIGEGFVSLDSNPNVFLIEDGKILPGKKENVKTGAKIAFDKSGEKPEGSMKNVWIIKDTSLYNDMRDKGFRISEKGVEFPPFMANSE